MDVQDFLKLYPWLDEHLQHGEPVHWFWSFEVEASPQELWPYVIETSKINREVGYEEATYEEREGILHGKMTGGANPVEWVEIPWNWNYARSVGNVRLYSSGVTAVQRTHLYFGDRTPEGKQTIYVYIGCIPVREKFATLLKRYFDPRGEGYGRALKLIETAIKAKRSTRQTFNSKPLAPDRDARGRLDHIKSDLLEWGQPVDLVEQLIRHLLTADELDLHRLRILELARSMKVNSDALLTLCLYAVRAGLLTLSWDVICPHCRNTRRELATLAHVPPVGHCDVCGVDFNVSDEKALEITFRVHPSIAEVPRRFFCLGEASSKPHIMVQHRLPPGQTVTIETMLGEGSYRLRRAAEEGLGHLDVLKDAQSAQVEWKAGQSLDDAKTQPNFRLTLSNPTGRTQVFVVEQLDWEQDVLRPAALLGRQDFRDLFSYEALATDLYLDVGVQTIMFSDAIGSTSLYTSAGDAGAFLKMSQHFQSIFDIARHHRGAVVKTIGDGAMLVFPTPAHALAAALEMTKGKHSGISVRLSVHTGRCLAVNLNTGLDYFGQTVNIAAKLQELVRGGGIVFSQDAFEAPEVQTMVSNDKIGMRAAQLEYQGLDAPVHAHLLDRAPVKA